VEHVVVVLRLGRAVKPTRFKSCGDVDEHGACVIYFSQYRRSYDNCGRATNRYFENVRVYVRLYTDGFRFVCRRFSGRTGRYIIRCTRCARTACTGDTTVFRRNVHLTTGRMIAHDVSARAPAVICRISQAPSSDVPPRSLSDSPKRTVYNTAFFHNSTSAESPARARAPRNKYLYFPVSHVKTS